MEYWFSGEAEKDDQMLKYIQTLRQKGIKCYLATNNEKYRVKYLLDIVGLKNYFDGCFASCDLSYFKKEKGFWESVLKKLGNVKRSGILLLDDDLVNVESAKAFGLRAESYKDFSLSQSIIDKNLNTV